MTRSELSPLDENEKDRALLAVDDLVVRYDQRGGRAAPAVNGVSFQLHAGEVLGLAGASGSGKSTLARTLVQLLKPAQGTIHLEGQPLGAAGAGADQEARRRIQLVFQDPATALSPRRTVRQLLAEPARHFKLDASDQRLEACLEAVGLDKDALSRRPAAFSSGQRQRIAIARALICEPDLLIADEALASLDVSVQAQILALLRRLREERNIAMLLISHDLAVLRELADRIAVMFRGRWVETASTERFFSRPSHPYSQALLAALPGLTGNNQLQAPSQGLALPRATSGCVYEARCAHARAACAGAQPEPRRVTGSADHWVECLLAEEGLIPHESDEP